MLDIEISSHTLEQPLKRSRPLCTYNTINRFEKKLSSSDRDNFFFKASLDNARKKVGHPSPYIHRDLCKKTALHGMMMYVEQYHFFPPLNE